MVGSRIPDRLEISTGNDIVALNAIDRDRTVQPRFYSKIISGPELELFSRLETSGLSFEDFIWLLWSIKESTYKYWQRIIPDLIFSPTRIIIRQLDNAGLPVYRGIVHSAHGILHSHSTVTADHISTVVGANESFGQIGSGVAVIERADHAGQSASVRSLLLERLESLLPSEGGDLRIEKGPRGWPLLYKGGLELGIPVSLAHHGQFIAYSFAWNRPVFAGSGGPDLPGILSDEVFPTT